MYADSTAVLGPLAGLAEPHSYDLCPAHAERLTAPRGWEVVRLSPRFAPLAPTPDDLVALAEAVREAGRRSDAPEDLADAVGAASSRGAESAPLRPGTPDVRRGHLRVVRPDEV